MDKSKKIFSHIFFTSFLLASCAAQNCTSCGAVLVETKFWNSIKKEFVFAEMYGPDIKVWYKDSIVIVKAMGLIINQDAYGLETRKLIVYHYTYIDLPTRSFYEYKSFSDTARLTKKYTQPDSISGEVGWTFYAPHPLLVTEPVQVLPDTTIENIVYKRVKLVKTIKSEKEEWKSMSIVYARCDKKGTMFQFDKRLSEQIGCPIVKWTPLPIVGKSIAPSGEIKFVADKLTPVELKIFEAWGKIAKENPIQ